MPRKYAPIWEQLKLHRKAVVIAPPDKMQQIIQAVRKEKWRDDTFRLKCIAENKPYRLYAQPNKKRGTIEFLLRLGWITTTTIDDL